jgi:hypothetical protein
MIGLALLAGVILGLRFRIGLVLTATAIVLASGIGIRMQEDTDAGTALAMAALYAVVAQVVAFLVLIVKAAVHDRAGARA